MYLAKQDFIDELGESIVVELTASADSDEINDDRLGKAIGYAQGLFDMYMRQRYTLPVAATAMVKALNLDLAIAHLYKSRASVMKDSVYEVKRIAHDDAIKRLKDIGDGKAALDIPAVQETVEAPTTGDRILTNASRNRFSDRTLKGY